MRSAQIRRLVTAGAAFVLSCGVAAYAQQSKPYINTALNYKLQYPSEFQLKTINGAVIFSSPLKNKKDVFAESVNIVVLRAGQSVKDLKSFYEIARRNLSGSLTNVKILEDKKTKLAGKEAYLLIYTVKDKKTTFKFMQIMTMNDRVVYAITFTAFPETYEEYLSKAQVIVNSFAYIK